MSDLLPDLTSGDGQRVWSAANAIIKAPESDELRPLLPHLPAIRRATGGLELGGALFPNREHVQQAIRVLEALRDHACRCALYPPYLFYNPEQEAAAHHVTITAQSEPDWNMTYQCQCLHCGRAFEVEQGESHYTWWQWRPKEAASSETGTDR